MAEIFAVENLVGLLTLTILEIVLGIDNIIFISILAGKLPPEQQNKARTIGLSLALITRVILLLFISFLMGMTKELFGILGHGVTGKDIVLIAGGLFLIYKATKEIHHNMEGPETHDEKTTKGHASLGSTITQIILLDIVFSLDSVITAVGMVQNIPVMITAVVIAMGVMLFAAKPISDFVNRHPTVQMLALSFLLLVGVVLVADGAGHHVPKGYIYFAMAFSVGVEMLNLKMRSRRGAPVKLHKQTP